MYATANPGHHLKKHAKRLRAVGVILMILWLITMLYGIEFIDRTDLYGTSKTISDVFGYAIALSSAPCFIFIFLTIDALETEICAMSKQIAAQQDELDFLKRLG